MVKKEEEHEHLGVLGYKVRSSRSQEVALKLKQLEAMMGNVQQDGLAHFAMDTVHYQWNLMIGGVIRTTITTTTASASRPVILVDTQNNGVHLVHSLMACAEAIKNSKFTIAEALVKQIGFLAVSQAGAMRKVATYFANTLVRWIYRLRVNLANHTH
ncbi:DELLA protein RGA-like [Brassica napus]|uniref:DELLA protein RGA-like n=1 Tax=Brassica napus TaxID=3708 RepID=UPI0020787386|nr:DELLA protein RGA-like [Brassica napus]